MGHPPIAALGVDVSTRKLAFAALDEHGNVRQSTFDLAPATGARRLVNAREVTRAAVGGYRDACVGVVVVEIPWARDGSSFALLSVVAVVLEAVQSALPAAVVLDMPTPSWKRESVGSGSASKGDVMRHARALGLLVDDQDAADALCMAQAGWNRWLRDVGGWVA